MAGQHTSNAPSRGTLHLQVLSGVPWLLEDVRPAALALPCGVERRRVPNRKCAASSEAPRPSAAGCWLFERPASHQEGARARHDGIQPDAVPAGSVCYGRVVRAAEAQAATAGPDSASWSRGLARPRRCSCSRSKSLARCSSDCHCLLDMCALTDVDCRRRRRLLAGGPQRPAPVGIEGHDVGGRGAPHPATGSLVQLPPTSASWPPRCCMTAVTGPTDSNG